MSQFVRHYLLAVQFFTRIPVTGRLADWVGFSPAMLRASAAHFPGVGWLVGACVAGLSAVLMAVLPGNAMTPLVVAVLGTALSVWMTGGFHEDGLADLTDGLGGSPRRERALEIMKDSRIGAFGAMALVMAMLAKVSLLALIGAASPNWMVLGLFSGHVVSRTLPLLHIRLMPHVGDAAGSKSKPLADQIDGASLGAAFLWCFLALAIVGIAQAAMNNIATTALVGLAVRPALVGVACALLAWAYLWRLLWRRLQGFTGDGLGATQQLCELAFYFGLALAL